MVSYKVQFLHTYIYLYSICCSLSVNGIGDEGARAIADGMKYCTSLETLM